MPGTYSQLLYHIVFSTKRRVPWIKADLAPDLYAYLGGIIRAQQGTLLKIGGVEDHVHLYVRFRTDATISGLLRETKAGSSQWIHKHSPGLRDFAWQEGYSVFSVSKSQEHVLTTYIDNQAEHHRKEDFRAELLRLLHFHGVEFDEQYVFD